MTSLAHALIGIAIVAKIPNPEISVPLALASHFLCDAIPHWDLGTNWKTRPKYVTAIGAILDTLIALSTFFIFYKIIAPVPLMLNIVFAILPDWLSAPYFIFFPVAPKIFTVFYKIQSYIHNRLDNIWGIVTQVVTVAVFLAVAFLI